MSIVQELFKKIDSRKAQTAASTFKPYRELLIALCNGKETDDAEAEIILEQHGKTQAELTADVATMRQRLQWSKNIELRKQATADAANFHNQIEAANREFSIHQKKHDEQINAITPKLQTAESVVLRCSNAETQLRRTCLDPAVFAREEPLIVEQKKLNKKRQEIAADLDVARRRVEWASAALAKAGKVRIKSILPDGKAKEQEQQIKQLKENVANLETAVAAKQKQLRQVDIELAKCRKALEQLHELKLKP